MTVREALRSRNIGDVAQYTTYQVTVRLNGKQRTYRATALHTGRLERTGAPETVILDNVTSEINTALKDMSPKVISPWKEYVKSGLYLAVVEAIRDADKAGRSPIPAEAPLGYLPGDDVVPKENKPSIHRCICLRNYSDFPDG